MAMTSKRNIEAVYPLSPMQQGMLFHSLYAPDSELYFEQMICTLRGHLNVPAFERAWQRVLDLHTVLRTAFVWKRLDKMLQVVAHSLELPVAQLDWREFPTSELEARLEAFLREDRRRGFDLSKAPLMRLVLIRVAEDTYRFVWSHHHLLLDGWSVPILLKEVFDAYEAFCHGREPQLPPTRPYRDYIAWLKRQDLSRARAFWRDQLKGFSYPTSLVVGNHPEGSVEPAYDLQRVWLPADATAALQSLARRHRLTLNTIVQGAWGLLLSRYSDQEDVVFGATVSGRPADLLGAESMVGLFINTLPVRVRVIPRATVVDWLGELQAQQVELRQYEFSPLVRIQEWSEVPRGQALFESILVFENYPVEASLLEQRGSLRFLDVRTVERTNYPLTVVAAPGPELMLGISFDRTRFDVATVAGLLGQLCTILEGMVADPYRRLSTVSLLTLAERRRVLLEWNDTVVEHSEEACIQGLFEAQVERTPDGTAVVFEGERVSYRELNRRANQLGSYLRKLGVGPNVLVGICVERSLGMVVAILGVLKAGGAYLPLDPQYPQQRLAFMLRDAKVAVLLTQAQLAERLAGQGGRVVLLDGHCQLIARESEDDLGSAPGVDDLAYVIYTSGSTGVPKGVMVPRRALVSHVLSSLEEFGLEPGDRLLQFISPSFDAFGEGFFAALLSGATVVVPSSNAGWGGTDLVRLCEREGISFLHLPAPVWHQWVDDMEGDSRSLRIPLKLLVLGGDCPSVDRLRTWTRLIGHPFTFVNAYGPTEATVTATRFKITLDPRNDLGLSRLPIGRPTANVRVYLLDQWLEPVGMGVPGELYIGGAGVGLGYLGRPELTAEKFVPDPFSGESGARLYRTGDLGRYLPDGNLEFLGRVDHQVKVRGFRIEPGEIETVLGQHPAVRETVVVARQDDGEDRRLVAYLVPATDSRPTIDDLRGFLKARLPEHMLPSAFVLLEALPLTPNGKVDRKALPAPGGTRPELKGIYVAPRDPQEEIVAGIFAQVLSLDRVGIHDNFFELGGHSLLATQLVSRMREALQIEVPLRVVFESPTVARLARSIDAWFREAQGLEAMPPMERVSRDGDLPLSFAQQRLWFLDQLEPGSPFYNNPAVVRLVGLLDRDAFECSLNEVVHRHEALRTSFATVDGRPIQTIASGLTLTLSLVDLGHLPHAEREVQALRLAQAETQKPFDLTQGPLLRGTLLRLAEDEHIVLLTLHHIVSDGWSMGVLIQELAALYEAFCKDRSLPLPDLPIQYADFAHWQRQYLQGKNLESQLAYWKTQLLGAPPLLELPTDRPRPAVQSSRGAHQVFSLSESLSRSLKVLSQQEGVTLYMTLLGAFQVLLHRYSGQEDICVGSPIANRNRGEIEGLIGFFVNTLVLRVDLSGDPTFRELLGRVREVSLGAYAHQDLPFEMLVEALQPERDMSHNPLFQVMFVLDNVPLKEGSVLGLSMRPLVVESGTARFDLTLSIREDLEGLGGYVEYNTDLFDATTIVRMIGHYSTLLQNIVGDAEQRVSRICLLTASERRQILVDWNDTQAEYPRDVCIHELFEARVERMPEEIALIFEERVLSYWELNRRANQLGRYLRKLGVGPEVLVGICVERSLEMIVGILGVLKAGGAYLPLDPEYPLERLAFMARDAGVPVLLTQKSLLGRVQAEGAREVVLDAEWEIIERESEDNLVRVGTAENLAYVIYTSGSTGVPKGTLLGHRGLCNLAAAQGQIFGLGVGSCILQFSPFSFDASVWETFMALYSGASLCLARQETLASTDELLQLLRRRGITVVTLPPSVLGVLPAEGLPSLRTVIAAGESCTREIVQSWGSGRRFYNAYGPTEATVCASVELCQQQDERNPTIGRPIPNTRLYVLDRNLQLLPVGVSGELHIGGDGLARGYLNRPELSREKFVVDPYSGGSEGRLYRTGDLVRYRVDGSIEFLGRIDQQVKVRGIRIELGEIEVVMRQHRGVKEGVVVVREGVGGDKRLVGYVVMEGEGVSLSELREFLRERLPEYMVPKVYVVVERLPISPSGKVDRRGLPELEGGRGEMEVEYVGPRTETEEVVARMCAELLGLERVGVHDNFFELGGHSLLATQLISRLREAFLIELPLRTLFERPTIAQLCDIIEEGRRADLELAASPMVRLSREAHRVKLSSIHSARDGAAHAREAVSETRGM